MVEIRMTRSSENFLRVGLSGELFARSCVFMVTENQDNRNMEPQEEQLAAPVRRMKYGVMEKKFMVSVKNIWN